MITAFVFLIFNLAGDGPPTPSLRFTDRAVCERVAEATHRARPGLLIPLFEGGRACVEVPACENRER